MGDLLGKLSCCWKWCWWTSRGRSSLWSKYPKCLSAVMGTLWCRRWRLSEETLNRGPDTLWSLKIPLHSLQRVEGSLVSWLNSQSDSLNLPPNHPDSIGKNDLHFLSWCVMSVLLQNGSRASPRWVLHIGGGWGKFPPHPCKSFECLEKRYINVVIYPSDSLHFTTYHPLINVLFLLSSPRLRAGAQAPQPDPGFS